MSKPVKYRILLLKDDIIILKRMTVDKVNPGPKKPSRIERVEQRIGGVEKRIDCVEKRMAGVEQWMDRIEYSINSLREIIIDGFKAINKRLDNLVKKNSLIE